MTYYGYMQATYAKITGFDVELSDPETGRLVVSGREIGTSPVAYITESSLLGNFHLIPGRSNGGGFQRVGDYVHFWVELDPSSKTDNGALRVPLGFRPTSQFTYVPYTDDGAILAGKVILTGATNYVVTLGGTGDEVECHATWRTQDPWPTSFTVPA